VTVVAATLISPSRQIVAPFAITLACTWATAIVADAASRTAAIVARINA